MREPENSAISPEINNSTNISRERGEKTNDAVYNENLEARRKELEAKIKAYQDDINRLEEENIEIEQQTTSLSNKLEELGTEKSPGILDLLKSKNGLKKTLKRAFMVALSSLSLATVAPATVNQDGQNVPVSTEEASPKQTPQPVSVQEAIDMQESLTSRNSHSGQLIDIVKTSKETNTNPRAGSTENRVYPRASLREKVKANPLAGETINNVVYDYSHYADIAHKSSPNAFDYDYSDRHGDVERTKEGWLEVAKRTPEALAAYSYYAFTDQEKQSLGIDGMTIADIDDYMSDENNPDGGVMQRRLYSGLVKIAKKDAVYNFYYENDTENTNYIFFVDDNKDGIMTPDEMHVGYSTVKRNNAAQVDVSRMIDGKLTKILDLNEYCGYQVNTVTIPEGVRYLEDEEVNMVLPVIPVTPDKTPDETPTPNSEPTPEPEPTSEPEEEPEEKPGEGEETNEIPPIVPGPKPDKPDEEPEEEPEEKPGEGEETNEIPPIVPGPQPQAPDEKPEEEPEDKPDEEPEEKPESRTPKDEDKEKEYAGDSVDQMKVDPNKATTETEHEQEEAANRESVEQQKKEDAEKEIKADETQKTQAEAESEAATTAENRRKDEQAAYDNMSAEEKAAENAARLEADKDKAKNEEGASANQQQANETTNSYIENREQAKQAQDAANAAAENATNIPGQSEAADGTLNADDFANIANQYGF